MFLGIAEHPDHDDHQGDDDHQAQNGVEGAGDDAGRAGNQLCHQNYSKDNQQAHQDRRQYLSKFQIFSLLCSGFAAAFLYLWTKPGQHIREICRKLRFQKNRLPGAGMHKAQPPGMEALTLQPFLRRGRAVSKISQQRVADAGHVYPDLVGAAGLQAAENVGVAPVGGRCGSGRG